VTIVTAEGPGTLELWAYKRSRPRPKEARVHIADLHSDHKLWLNALGFYKQGVGLLENRLADIARRNTAQEVMAELEHFQNQYIRQKEVIDTVRNAPSPKRYGASETRSTTTTTTWNASTRSTPWRSSTAFSAITPPCAMRWPPSRNSTAS
jgi:hypothetical protein